MNMSNSLKDALIKAGVVSKDNLDREKEKVRRENIQSKGPTQHGIHAHHIRTDCGHCSKGAPDVEYYEHTNRSIEAKWLCIPCADKASIKDDCRQTNQSSYSKAGTFRRFFGMTKRFPAGATISTPGGAGGPQKPASGVNQPNNKNAQGQGPQAGARSPAPSANLSGNTKVPPQQTGQSAQAKAAERAAMNVLGKVLTPKKKPHSR